MHDKRLLSLILHSKVAYFRFSARWLAHSAWKGLLHDRYSVFRKARASKTGIQFKGSGIPLTIEIRNPRSTEKESGIYNLEFVIHSVES